MARTTAVPGYALGFEGLDRPWNREMPGTAHPCRKPSKKWGKTVQKVESRSFSKNLKKGVDFHPERVYYNEAVTNDSGLNERLKNKIKKVLDKQELA